MDELRGTGRTTKMLKEAVKAAKKAKLVIVFLSHQHEYNHCMILMADITKGELMIRGASRTVDLPNGSQIKFYTNFEPHMFDYELARRDICPLRGYRSDTPFFFDHHVLDTRPWAKYN